MVFLIQILLVLSPNVFAAEDCGARLSTEASIARFDLSSATKGNLDLDASIMEVIEPYLRTEMGERRLVGLVQSPFLDSAHIRARQEAVRYLVDHPLVRQQLSGLLHQMESFDRGFKPVDLGFFEQTPAWRRASYAVSAVAAVTWIAFAARYAYVPRAEFLSEDLLSFTAAFSVSSSLNLIPQNMMRTRIRTLNSMIGIARVGSGQLADTNVNVLDSLQSGLSASYDKCHPQEVCDLARSLNHILPATVDWLGNLFTLTNWSTARFRQKITNQRDQLEVLSNFVGELDVLVALADLFVAQKGDYVWPVILATDQPTQVKIVQGHHPSLRDNLRQKSVANDFRASLGEGEPRTLLLSRSTGEGKKTYVNMVANLTVMAQIGAPVPAQAMEITPVALLTNDQPSDFKSQVSQLSALLAQAKDQPHALVILRGLFNGLSVEEKLAAESAVIKYLATTQSLAIFSGYDSRLEDLERANGSAIEGAHFDQETPFQVKSGPPKSKMLKMLIESKIPDSIVQDANREFYLHSPVDE